MIIVTALITAARMIVGLLLLLLLLLREKYHGGSSESNGDEEWFFAACAHKGNKEWQECLTDHPDAVDEFGNVVSGHARLLVTPRERRGLEDDATRQEELDAANEHIAQQIRLGNDFSVAEAAHQVIRDAGLQDKERVMDGQ